jgi:dGTP triphosphohydrolase
MNKSKITRDPEYVKKLEKYQALKTELVSLISERDLLENTVRKNLEALYATRIGKNEYALYRLECDIARLKRKIELFQAKINHGQKPDILEIEDKLDREYQKWEKEISGILENIEKSRRRLENLREDGESIELHKIYRILVKKLHPDVITAQTERTNMLWNRTMDAYKYGDLEELKAIAILVEDEKDTSIQGMDIEERIRSISQKVCKLLEYIKKIRSEFPFTIEKDIEDEGWVAGKNDEIFSKIDKLEDKKTGLQEIIDALILEYLGSPGPGTVN